MVERVWPLNLHIIQDIPEDLLNCSIADMVDDGGQDVGNICSFTSIPGGYDLGRLQSSYIIYGGG